jgi:hypothetical protein
MRKPTIGVSWIVLGILLSRAVLFGEAIPAERLPPSGRWEPGIRGGIPVHYTQFCNVLLSIPGSSLRAAGDGVTDDTAAINAALAACPDGQYVYLPEGDYRCNGTIGRAGSYRHDNVQRHFSVLLKGDGPGRTRIFSYATGDSIAFTAGLGAIGGGAIASGNTRGSTEMTAPLQRPALFAAGTWMLVRRSNLESGVVNTPSYMTETASQLVRLTAVESLGAGQYRLRFDPALNEGYPSDRVDVPCSVPYRCGLEDLYVERMTSSPGNNIVFTWGQECWVKNVESVMARKWHIRLNSSAGCEVRECYLHEAWDAGGDAGYGVGLFAYTCNTLVENNVGARLRHAFILEYGGQNNVIAYNYSKDPVNNDRGPGRAAQLATDYLMGDLCLHGGHPRWNLFEGNVAATLKFDYVLGGSDYNTAFRNRLQRKGLPSTYVGAFGSDIQRGNHRASLVGNIYEAPPANATAALRRWGTNQDNASNPDPLSESTAYLHGEYDSVTGVTVWSPVNSDRALPASYYRTAAPDFFGALPWPVFGPDNPAGATAADLPAVVRFQTQLNAAPTITVQPQGVNAAAGSPVAFEVRAAGTAPMSYQWRKDGVVLGGATASRLTFSTVQMLDAGEYTVVITNVLGSATSTPARLTVSAEVEAPHITSQPAAQTAIPGTNVSFSVVVTGSAPLTYQWLLNGNPLQGETAALLSVSDVRVAHAGEYAVRVTNAAGVVQSNAAALTVNVSPVYYVSVSADSAGRLLVGDAANHVILQIAADNLMTIRAGTSGMAGAQGGLATSARFNQPMGLTVDAEGQIYIADTGNALVRKISPAGQVSVLAGDVSARGHTDGVGGAARFSSPRGLAMGPAGTLYLSDAYTHTIRKITGDGIVATLAGAPGVRGAADGAGAQATFNQPIGLAVDASGHIYVADSYNHVVRKITPEGVVTTFAGLPGVSGYANGSGQDVRFHEPVGLAVDPSGALYVADTGNSVIRKISPTGLVTTLAGTPGVAGRRDGAGIVAEFNQPQGIWVAGSGAVIVADTGNNVLRRIEQAGTVSTLAIHQSPPAGAGASAKGASSGGGGAHSPAAILAGLVLLASRCRRQRRSDK